jgi:hypothetical protein
MPFEPCFHLEKIDARSFRGSWMGFAYCDFTCRMSVAGMSARRHSSEPIAMLSFRSYHRTARRNRCRLSRVA